MIFAIKPFEIHDGDGIRTTVFFKGCPLRCKWCHNPESLSPLKETLFDSALCISCLECVPLCDANIAENGKHVFLRELCTSCKKCEEACPKGAFCTYGMDMTATEIAAEVLKDARFMQGSGGGVTFSGGEPLMQVELCAEIAEILKKQSINIAIDTCCAVARSAIDKIAPYTDTFLIDVKAIDEKTHIACTGASNKTILENILYIDSLGIPIEIRYPFVPQMNDGELVRIAEFVAKLKNVKHTRILGYHNYAEEKYGGLGKAYPLSHITPPSKRELALAVERMKETGLQSVSFY